MGVGIKSLWTVPLSRSLEDASPGSMDPGTVPSAVAVVPLAEPNRYRIDGYQKVRFLPFSDY